MNFLNFSKRAVAVTANLEDVNVQATWKKTNFKGRTALMWLFITAAFSQTTKAQDAAEEINELWEEQINPILNAVLGIAVGIAAVWCGIQFFQGKKEALKTLGYIIAGAVVIKVLATLVKSIIGTD